MPPAVGLEMGRRRCGAGLVPRPASFGGAGPWPVCSGCHSGTPRAQADVGDAAEVVSEDGGRDGRGGGGRTQCCKDPLSKNTILDREISDF